MKNTTALILGNGPSINKFNPKILDRVTSFGTNAIGNLFEKWNRQTDNIVITDHNRLREFGSTYKTYKGNLYIGHNLYIIPPRKKIENTINRHFIPLKQLTWPTNYIFEKPLLHIKLNRRINRYLLNKEEISLDINKGFLMSSSVIITAIQLSAALGFTKILLTGVDASYQTKTDYATGINAMQNPAPRMFGYNFRADLEPLLVKLQIIFEDKGIELIDCTPNGKLSFIKKSDLEKETRLKI